MQMTFYGYNRDLTSEFGSVFRAPGTVTWPENCELQTRLRIEMIRSAVHDDQLAIRVLSSVWLWTIFLVCSAGTGLVDKGTGLRPALMI